MGAIFTLRQDGIVGAGEFGSETFINLLGLSFLASSPEEISQAHFSKHSHIRFAEFIDDPFEDGLGVAGLADRFKLGAERQKRVGLERMIFVFVCELLQGIHGRSFLVLFPEQVGLLQECIARGKTATMLMNHQIQIFHRLGRSVSFARFHGLSPLHVLQQSIDA